MTALSKTILGLSDDQVKEIAKALGIPDKHDDISFMKFTDEEWSNNAKIRKAVAYIGFDAKKIVENAKVRKSVAYIGFDAKKIVEQFFKKADSNKRGDNDLMIEVGGVKMYEKNDANTDLMFFLRVFLERGNNLQKALLRCDDAIAPTLKLKAQAYGITLEKGQNRTILGTRHLTLARLAHAFAHSTATLIIKYNIPSKLTSKLFPGLPLLMEHTIFPALIPVEVIEITDALRNIAQFVNIEMTYMLADPKQKRKMAVRSLEDLAEQSQMYIDAAMNGSVISNGDRTSILIKAGVLVLDNNKIKFTDAMNSMIKRLAEIKKYQMHPLSGCLAQLTGNM